MELITVKHKTLGLIILASVPAGVAGFLLNNIAEHALRKPVLISVMLIIVGMIMLFAEKSYKYKGIDKTGFADAIIVGIAQALAIIPGVSRSGITISAGLFMGFEREAAARFSFLLATPIIGGAMLLHLKKALSGDGNYDLQLFAAGLIASFVTGYIAIKFLLNYLKKHSMNIFVYYRFILSVVIIAGIWLKK